MTTKERLKKYIKYKNLTVISFEKSLNVSNGYVSSISKSIQPDKLLEISEKYTDLSIEWLLIGKGEMIKTEKIQNPQRDETLDVENIYQLAYFKQRIAELEATIQTLITTNKQLANTIDRLTSDPGMPGNAMLIKTTKSTNGSIQPVIHVAELDNTKYQARKKRMILKK